MEQIVTAMPLLIIFLIWGKYVVKTYFSPSGIMIGIWCLFLLTHALLAPDFKFSYSSGFIIDLLIIFFFIGEFTITIISKDFVKSKHTTQLQLNNIYGFSFENKLKRTIITLGLISIMGSLMYVYIFYKHFGSFTNLFTAGWLIRQEIGEGLIRVPFIIRLMALIGYPTLVLSLVYWICFDFRWFLTIPFLSMFLMGIAQAARAGTFMMLITIFIAGYWRDRMKGSKHIGYRLCKRIIAFAIIIIIIFTMGLMYREQNINLDVFASEQFVGSYKSYAYGAISAFSVFFDQYSFGDSMTFGAYSFSSLFQLLGIREFVFGFYDEYLFISNVGNEYTNVYTLFRSAIEDFGISGALAYMFLMGAVISYAFRYAIKGNLVALAFILMSYTMVVYSVVAPLTQHNTILLSFVMPSLILFMISKNKCRRLPSNLSFHYEPTEKSKIVRSL